MAPTRRAPAPGAATGTGVPGPDGDHRIGAVALAEVTWVRWGPLPAEPESGQPAERHRRFVASLLVPGASLRRTTGTGTGWATVGSGAEDVLDEVVDGLAGACRLSERRLADPVAVTAALNRYALRLHLPVPALRALLDVAAPNPGPSGGHGVLDLRFRYHLGHHWMYATLSLGTDRPTAAEFAPPPGPDGNGTHPGTATGDLGGVRERFEQLAAGFRGMLDRAFVSVESTVLDDGARSPLRRYLPPRFWLVLCDHDHDHGTGACPALTTLCRESLGVPSPAAIGVSTETVVARGRATDAVPVTVVRHLDRTPAGAAPAYLLAPAPGDGAARERGVAALVGRLSAVEGSVAAQLLDTTTELDIDDSFTRLYAAVAHQGSLLWDELALNLPVLDGADLDQLHRLIELVHLTLLQSLADLQHLGANATRTRDELASGQEAPVDRLEHEFVGTAEPDPGRALGPALRSGGYIGPTRRWADGVSASAAAVLAQVESLLGAISHAFDERRVRDTDKIGRAGLYLALGLASVGLVTETYGALLNGRTLPLLFSLLAGIVVALTLLGMLARRSWVRRHAGLSSTAHFRQLFPRVHNYVAECRAEKLAEARRLAWATTVAPAREDELRAAFRHYHDRWDSIDLFLARTFADLVDELQRAQPRRPRSALHDLRTRVEQWALFAILVSERPRSFYAYPLPRLTLLYCFVPVLGRRADLYGPHGERPALVSDADLLLTLRLQCGADLDHIASVRAWGEQLTREAEEQQAPAVGVLERITATGVRAGMSREEWAQTYGRIRAALGTGDG